MSSPDSDSRVFAAFIAASDISKTDWNLFAALSGRYSSANSARVNFNKMVKRMNEQYDLTKDASQVSPTKAGSVKGPVSPTKPAGVTKKSTSPKKRATPKGKKSLKQELDGFINDDDDIMNDAKEESDVIQYDSDEDVDLDGVPLKSK